MLSIFETTELGLICTVAVSVIVFLTFSVYGLIKKQLSYKNYGFLCSRSTVDLLAMCTMALQTLVPLNRPSWSSKMMLDKVVFASMLFNLTGLCLQLFSIAFPLVVKRKVTGNTCILLLTCITTVTLVWTFSYLVSFQFLISVCYHKEL